MGSPVGGYHPAKLKITNDFIQKTKNISSFSLMKMLNVHYIISQQPIQFPGLVEVFKGKMRSGRGVISPTVYELKDKLPRAWFVEKVEAKSNDQLWGMINEANFNPEDIAYIKSDDDRAGVYSKGTINNIEKSIHTLRLNVSCE